MTRIEFRESTEGRYDRQGLIPWWNQKKVSNARVIVAGAGALGNEVLKLLALMGVGQILVIDFDTISRSNLARTVLFRESDVGSPKAHVAAARLREINPEVNIRSVQGDLRFAVGLGEFRAADMVFGCLDSVNARWALNRKCMQAGVEWIDGGISDFHGSVARYSPVEGACYECNFTARSFERFYKRYSCPFGLVSNNVDEKLPTTAVTTSVIAAIQVQQALFKLHALDDGLKPGERLSVYLKPYRMIKDQLPVNPQCLAHDPLPDEIHKVHYSRKLTMQQAIQEALQFETGVDTLLLPYEFVLHFNCLKCGEREIVNKPKENVRQNDSICPKCGQMRVPEVVSSISLNTPLADLTFSDLGIPDQEIFSFSGGQNKIYLQFGPS